MRFIKGFEITAETLDEAVTAALMRRYLQPTDGIISFTVEVPDVANSRSAQYIGRMWECDYVTRSKPHRLQVVTGTIPMKDTFLYDSAFVLTEEKDNKRSSIVVLGGNPEQCVVKVQSQIRTKSETSYPIHEMKKADPYQRRSNNWFSAEVRNETAEKIVRDLLDLYIARADQYRTTRNIGSF